MRMRMQVRSNHTAIPGGLATHLRWRDRVIVAIDRELELPCWIVRDGIRWASCRSKTDITRGRKFDHHRRRAHYADINATANPDRATNEHSQDSCDHLSSATQPDVAGTGWGGPRLHRASAACGAAAQTTIAVELVG
jgi:hypothetical protein